MLYLWDTVTGEILHRLKGHSHDISALAFSPDGSRLASASADCTALVWDMAAVGRDLPPPYAVTPANLERLWTVLGGTNATRAEDVIWSLAAAPERALPFLQKNFQPIPRVDAARLAQLIAGLDDKVYANSPLSKNWPGSANPPRARFAKGTTPTPWSEANV
jgi:hypothetical protein